MEENKTKEPEKLIRLGKTNFNKKLRPIIKSFVVLESHINEKIVANNLNMQNKINNIKQYDIAFKNNNNDVSKEENDMLTPEIQQMIRQTIIDKLEADKEKEEQSLIEEKENARAEAIQNCKDAINEYRQELEDKVNAKKERLNAIQAKMKDIKKDLEEVKNSIATLKLKPESRTFKTLDKEQQEIIEQKKSLSREKRIANKNVKSAKSDLEDFDKVYGIIDFESENFINDILKKMYGKEGERADYSMLLLEDEWEETLDKVQDVKKVGEFLKKLEKAKQEQAKKKEENKKQGQETKPNPTQKPEQKPNPNPEQKPEQKPNPNPVQKPEQKPTPKPEQQLTPEEREILNVNEHDAEISIKEKSIKMLGSGKNKSKQYPRLTYVAKKDSYLAEDKDGKIVIIKRGKYSDKAVKNFISQEIGVDVEELGYVDASVVLAWMKYDDRYGTNETMKYIQSILKPDMSKENKNSANVLYNLKGLHTNKNISAEEKNRILECANYAQEFNIANVKKGFIASITERISNTIKRSNNNKLDKGKSGAEIIAEDLKNREARKRENKFKKEIQVTSAYKDIGRQISSSDKDGLDNILTNAREELREGKISTTEYSGLIYSANNRRKELSSAKPSVKKEPVASTPQQELEELG
ncbi:MAG: hypothetical protein HFJ47_02900 [Clostridia bacterium]|nr:hypothetical protein [Clostridia bacterium]